MTMVYFRVAQNAGLRGCCTIPCPVPDTFWKAAEQVQIVLCFQDMHCPLVFWCLSLTDVSRSEFQKWDFLSISILSLPTNALPGRCSGLLCLLFRFLHFSSLIFQPFPSANHAESCPKVGAQFFSPTLFVSVCFVFQSKQAKAKIRTTEPATEEKQCFLKLFLIRYSYKMQDWVPFSLFSLQVHPYFFPQSQVEGSAPHQHPEHKLTAPHLLRMPVRCCLDIHIILGSSLLFTKTK